MTQKTLIGIVKTPYRFNYVGKDGYIYGWNPRKPGEPVVKSNRVDSVVPVDGRTYPFSRREHHLYFVKGDKIFEVEMKFKKLSPDERAQRDKARAEKIAQRKMRFAERLNRSILKLNEIIEKRKRKIEHLQSQIALLLKNSGA